MIIVLEDGRTFEVNCSDDIIDNDIDGIKITSCERKDEFDVIFTKTDDLLSYLTFIEENSDKQDAMCVYLNNVSPDNRTVSYIDGFTDSYLGEFDSDASFAKERELDINSEVYAKIPSYIVNAIDWHKMWESNVKYDHWYHGLHYFRNN